MAETYCTTFSNHFKNLFNFFQIKSFWRLARNC